MIRPETLDRMRDVLTRIDAIYDLSDSELGRLKSDAFSALANLQTDLRLKFDYSEVAA